MCRETRTYRDKFVAHLDSDHVAHTPHCDLLIASSIYYHSYLVRTEFSPALIHGLPSDLGSYYERCAAEAYLIYAPRQPYPPMQRTRGELA